MKILDWLGRMSGSTAGSSALVRERRDKKQRALIGEVRVQTCFSQELNQKWIRESERIEWLRVIYYYTKQTVRRSERNGDVRRAGFFEGA